MWDQQIAVLSREFQVLRYDTRGHGRSTATSGAYSLEVLADDLKGLLDAVGIRQTHFVGLSMGGMIGQVFALKYQDMLKTLILCDTTSSDSAAVRPIWAERIAAAQKEGTQALVASTLDRWFTKAFREAKPEVMQRFGNLISSTPMSGYIGCSEALVEINVTDRLKEIRVPVLVVVGEHDPGTPVAMARTIHENLPDSELAVIESAAHFPNVEQPDAFSGTLLKFLQSRS